MITICYTYYNRPDLFEKVRDHYLALPEAKDFRFNIVDDGSQEKPLDPDEIPEGWDAFRIVQDLPFNFNGARNLNSHTSETPWLFYTDLDHVVPPETLQKLKKIIKSPSAPKKLHRFNRLHYKSQTEKPHGSTYLVKKSLYEAVGGYDEDVTGYGNDIKFARKFGATDFSGGKHIKYHMDYYVENFVGDVWEDPDKQKIRNVVNPNYPDRKRLRFDWERI